MKYNFVYDKEFLESNMFDLSEEEKDVVFAVIVGQHNAIFHGYKPERLVNAIKKLTSGKKFIENRGFCTIETDLENAQDGIMYLHDFDIWSIVEQQFLYGHTLNDEHRCTQFIATTGINPKACVVPDVLNNFDIVYDCGGMTQIHDYSKTVLSKMLKCIIEYHDHLHSGCFITSKTLKIENYWMGDNAFNYITDLGKNDPIYARKIALVGRSISDVRKSSLTGMGELDVAKKYCVSYTKGD